MLGCIRCGACLNVCPVFRQIGGHAYGWVYPGPMGAVLTPLLAAHEGGDLPDASTLCGACMEACPVEIPLADLLVRLRADLRTAGPAVPFRLGGTPRTNRSRDAPRTTVTSAPTATATAPPRRWQCRSPGCRRSTTRPPLPTDHGEVHRPPASGFPWPASAVGPLRPRRGKGNAGLPGVTGDAVKLRRDPPPRLSGLDRRRTGGCR